MGGDAQGAEKKEDDTSLWIYIKAQKRIEVRLKKGEKSLSLKFIESSDKAETFNFKEFKKIYCRIKKGTV